MVNVLRILDPPAVKRIALGKWAAGKPNAVALLNKLFGGGAFLKEQNSHEWEAGKLLVRRNDHLGKPLS